MKKVAILILAAQMLCSCAGHYASNGEKQYLKADNGASLVVPAPLTGSNISHFYDLPHRVKSAGVSKTPPTALTIDGKS